MKKLLSVLAAGAWISLSEFFRNEILLKSYWTEHYSKLGLDFPDDPVNGALWGLWSFLFAGAIFVMARKFSLMQTAMLAWFVGFVLMWVVIGNMGVLPYKVLYAALPLSLLEAFVAAFLVHKISGKQVK